MKEFMLYIRNAGDAKAALAPEEHLAFIKKCEIYIERLKSENKLIAAQPIVREGFVVSKPISGWTSIAVDPTKEIQVGYYHIEQTILMKPLRWQRKTRNLSLFLRQVLKLDQ